MKQTKKRKPIFTLLAASAAFAAPLFAQEVTVAAPAESVSEESFQANLRQQAAELQMAIAEARNAINDARGFVEAGMVVDAERIIADIENALPVLQALNKYLLKSRISKLKCCSLKQRQHTLTVNLEKAKGLLAEFKAAGAASDKSEERSVKKLVSELENPYKQNIAEISPQYVRSQAKMDELIVKGRAQYIQGDLVGATRLSKK